MKEIEQKVIANEANIANLQREISDIPNHIDAAVDTAINKYVNGKINRLHQEVIDKNKEQDEKLDKIYGAIKWLDTLGNIVTKTGKITVSLVAIAAGFWALLKFLAFNIK